MVRLFVALPLPPEAQDRLALIAAVSRAHADVARQLPSDPALHRRVDGPTYDEVVDALSLVARARLRVDARRHRPVRKGEKARRVGIASRSIRRCLRLHDRVESVLVRAGLEPEARKYSPHVTLARLSARRPPPRGFVQIEPLAASGRSRSIASCSIRAVVRDGPVYEIEAEYRSTSVLRPAAQRRDEAQQQGAGSRNTPGEQRVLHTIAARQAHLPIEPAHGRDAAHHDHGHHTPSG